MLLCMFKKYIKIISSRVSEKSMKHQFNHIYYRYNRSTRSVDFFYAVVSYRLSF